jgi:LysM repeat protein
MVKMVPKILFSVLLLVASTFLNVAALPQSERLARRDISLPHPQELVRRECTAAEMPQGPDIGVRNQIYEVALSMNVNSKVMLAMMEAAITESWVNNLTCGDRQSLGVFQQQPQYGWGSPEQILNVPHATRAFLTVCIQEDISNPDVTAGELAQLVQDAIAGNRYDPNKDLAEQYIAEAADAVGQSPPTATSGSSNTASSSSTSSSNGDSSSDGDDDNDDSANPPPAATTPAPTHDGVHPGCLLTYQPHDGDTCFGVARKFNITLSQFYSWNPCIDQVCSNLELIYGYCVNAPN